MTNSHRKIAIIGAGVAGLVVAYRRALAGDDVVIFERNSFVGGQLVTTQVGGTDIECYYHHAFVSDTAIWALCAELGISDKVRWLPSSMGYYSGKTLYPFGTPASLMGFSPLGFWGRIQFVVSALWMTYGMSEQASQRYGVKEWFDRFRFKKAWEVIWKPLFSLKFAEDAEGISLTWLWGKFQTRGKSRKSGGTAEVLGYMADSFASLSRSLHDQIIANGGQVLLNTPVDHLISEGSGFIVNGEKFDRVVATVSSDILTKVTQWSPTYDQYLRSFRYKAAICLMVVSDRAWFPMYWINVGDSDIPFGGLIEHTQFESPDIYDGNHVMYLSRYVDEEDPLFVMPEPELVRLFLAGVRRMNPEFDESRVREVKVFRQRNAQPVVPKGYAPPSIDTEKPHLYWISTHHTYPYDRGINFAITTAEKVLEKLK